MSRRHFRALAAIVAALEGLMPQPVRWDLADSLADLCARENRAFDRGRFRYACRVADQRPQQRQAVAS